MKMWHQPCKLIGENIWRNKLTLSACLGNQRNVAGGMWRIGGNGGIEGRQ